MATMENHGAQSQTAATTGGDIKSASQALWTVQWMRAAAALMVVIGHSSGAVAVLARETGSGFTRSTILPWGASVDLFFVISGFIIVHASQKLFGQPAARVTFLKRRLTRIVPLYWLTTTLYLAMRTAATLKGGDPFPPVAGILASYFFVPLDVYSNGRTFPVFDLGWTLNYEIFFYAVLAFAIGFPRAHAVRLVLVLIVIFAVAGTIVPRWMTTPYVWTRPIVIDFGLGMSVGVIMSYGLRLSTALRLLTAIGGIVFLALDPMRIFQGPIGTTVANEWPRVIFAGLPASIALAGAVLGPQPSLHRILEPLTVLGDASYSLYLFHPFVLFTMEKLAQKSAAFRALDGGVIVAGTVISAIVIALFAHYWIELPMTRKLNAWINRAGSQRRALATPGYPKGVSR